MPPSSRARAHVLCFVLALGASGCAVDRAGRATDGTPRDAAVDARSDAAESLDAEPADLGLDQGFDAALCAVGTVDLDGDPRNGGECRVSAELCNGRDDDCDPATPDGADDAMIGSSCDGVDRDLCEEGVFRCEGGVARCSDVSPDSREVCGNAVDDDCDGAVDEADDAVDTRIFYADADADGHAVGAGSVRACSAPAGFIAGPVDDCDDTNASVFVGAPEICDGLDNDCNDVIDDGAAMCPCTLRRRDRQVYLFCKSGRDFASAELDCAASGYHLATVDDGGESGWLQGNARADESGRQWWIGLNDVAVEGTFAWTSGSTSSFRRWHSGEPNNAGNEDCVEINGWDADAWNDSPCSDSNYFICEAP